MTTTRNAQRFPLDEGLYRSARTVLIAKEALLFLSLLAFYSLGLFNFAPSWLGAIAISVPGILLFADLVALKVWGESRRSSAIIVTDQRFGLEKNGSVMWTDGKGMRLGRIESRNGTIVSIEAYLSTGHRIRIGNYRDMQGLHDALKNLISRTSQ